MRAVGADEPAEQEEARRARAAALAEMVRDAEDAGLYDLTENAVVERFQVTGEEEDLR
ncbi:MAG: hypothetical protein ACRDTM_08880 [Micromonosporaceae bacterium]